MRYLFEPEILHETAKKGMGLPNTQMLEVVRAELAAKYPDHISHEIKWIINNAGGCMYAVAVLHASLSEYLVFFGSSIGTSGHTGRHLVEIYDFVIDGELWYFQEENPLVRDIRKAGDQYYLPKGKSEGLAIKDYAWVLEYGRGPIPLILPFGFADAFFSTLDFKSVLQTLWIYGTMVLKELITQFKISNFNLKFKTKNYKLNKS
ncbi:hypothetical protein NIES4103_27190 [Nostoc sp. NIES-4103]|nr:hypothetical protein NIES4103_27190 [Nostoc sp. NIES-4103]